MNRLKRRAWALLTTLAMTIYALGVMPVIYAEDAVYGHWELTDTTTFGVSGYLNYYGSAEPGIVSAHKSVDDHAADETATYMPPNESYASGEMISTEVTVQLHDSLTGYVDDDDIEHYWDGYGFSVHVSNEELRIKKVSDDGASFSFPVRLEDLDKDFLTEEVERYFDKQALRIPDTRTDAINPDQGKMGSFTNTETLVGYMPEGHPGRISLVYALERMAGVLYTYEWVPEDPPIEPTQEKKENTLDVNGFLLDGMLRDMPGVPIEVQLTEPGTSGEALSREQVLTNKKGNFHCSLIIPENAKKPELKITVTLNHMNDKNEVRFRMIDHADPISLKENCICISETMQIPEQTLERVRKTGEGSILVAPCFALLESEHPCFLMNTYKSRNIDYQINLNETIDMTFEDQSVRKLTAEERIIDASMHYTTLYRCYAYAVDTLKEEVAMEKNGELLIYLRSRETIGKDLSFFRYGEGEKRDAIHLCADHCLHTDDALGVVMHEFGHAVDHRTTDAGEYHLSKRGEDDTSHGGIFNPYMDNSYTEGFATYYAALVRRSLGYKQPEVMPRSQLTLSARNFAYRYTYCGEEEDAIGTFLVQATRMIGKIEKTWPILKPSRDNFQAYYDELKEACPVDKQKELEDLALQMGLFRCPYEGNKKHDEGEPFRDLNSNGRWDTDEPWIDLIFDFSKPVNEQGKPFYTLQDPIKWEAYRYREDFKVGTVADYGRGDTRKNPPQCDIGYLQLLPEPGIEVDYVRVTVRPKNQAAYSDLSSTVGGVFLFDPYRMQEGTVTVEIPGGEVVYEGDMAEIAAQSIANGADAPAVTARVSKNQLPKENVMAVPVFEDTNAPGYILPDELSFTELAVRAGYDPEEYDLMQPEGSRISTVIVAAIAAAAVVAGIAAATALIVHSKRSRRRPRHRRGR